jgi:hypothetical protein
VQKVKIYFTLANGFAGKAFVTRRTSC